MEKHELKETISILYDMELNNYMMTRGLKQIEREISQLGHYKRFNKPVEYEYQSDYSVSSEVGCKVAVVGGIIGGVIGLISQLKLDDFSDFLGGLFQDFGMILLFAILGFAIGFGIVFLIVFLAGQTLENHKIGKLQADADRKYKYDLQEYNKKVKADNRRVEVELKRKNYLSEQRNRLKAKLDNSISLLRELYKASGINETYCTIMAIGYMNEFITLGISTKLEGADGLYYLVRGELRLDQMCLTLEEISMKLDTIIDNQKQIYLELQDMNQKCDNIIQNLKDISVQMDTNTKQIKETNESLNRIEENSQLNVYLAERTAKEAQFYNMMHLY